MGRALRRGPRRHRDDSLIRTLILIVSLGYAGRDSRWPSLPTSSSGVPLNSA